MKQPVPQLGFFLLVFLLLLLLLLSAGCRSLGNVKMKTDVHRSTQF